MDSLVFTILITVIGIHVSYSMELIRRQPLCEDAAPKLCQTELSPHFCYNDHNKAICCNSCQTLMDKTNKVCPYGDHNVLIKKDGKKYSCESYVTHFGRHRCSSSFEFRSQCCKTCNWRGL